MAAFLGQLTEQDAALGSSRCVGVIPRAQSGISELCFSDALVRARDDLAV